MAVDDFVKGLKAIDHEPVRARVAAGDFDAVGDLEMTDEERSLLERAAREYPEVAGFAYETYLKLQGRKQGQFKGESAQPTPLEIEITKYIDKAPPDLLHP